MTTYPEALKTKLTEAFESSTGEFIEEFKIVLGDALNNHQEAILVNRSYNEEYGEEMGELLDQTFEYDNETDEVVYNENGSELDLYTIDERLTEETAEKVSQALDTMLDGFLLQFEQSMSQEDWLDITEKIRT